MSETKEYKCPSCGGTVEFDAKTQKLKCPYCDTEFEVGYFDEEPPADAVEEASEAKKGDSISVEDSVDWNSGDTQKWDSEEEAHMSVYTCQSCGGEIIADDSTGATICPFCGNKVAVKGKFSGDLKPDYIIPFKLEKEDAKKAYREHLKNKTFLPSVFLKENTIDEIRGVYVPFWLFNADVEAEVSYSAEKYRVWREKKREYTETKYYILNRKGKIGFDNIPADGSLQMDDKLMESIEPFFHYDAVPFNAGYLAGYMADRYDVDVDSRIERVKERIVESTKESFRNTIVGYDYVEPVSCQVDVVNAEHKYALYPVWIMNTTWKGNKYTFAMNGQTGKMVGNLPTDKGKFWRYVGLKGLIFGAVLYGLMWVIMLI